MTDRISAPPLEEETNSQPWDDLAAVLKHAHDAQADRDSARAYTFYVRATELDSNNANAWAGKAATTTEIDEEIIGWAYTLALSPDNIQAQIRFEQSVGDRLEANARGDAPSLYRLARDLGEAGQKESAHKFITRATELDDTQEDYWVWRAGLASDLKEAISSLNQALALNPENARAQAGLQWALAQQAKRAPPPTASDAEQAAQFLAEGRALWNKNDKELAYEMFKRATELDQRNGEAWFWRGSCVEETDVDEALTCMEQALAINLDDEAAKEKRAWLRVRKLRERVPVKSAPVAAPHARAPAPAGDKRARALLLVVAVLVLILVVIFVLRPA